MKTAIKNMGGTAAVYIATIMIASFILRYGSVIIGFNMTLFRESHVINKNLINGLLKTVGLFGLLGAYKFIIKRNPFPPIRWRSVLVGLALAIFYHLLRLGFGLVLGPDEMEVVLNPQVPIWLLLLSGGLMFLGVLLEELLMRDLLLVELRHLMKSKTLIVFLVSFVFAILHYPQYDLVQLTSIFIQSIALTYLCIRYGNIGYALGIHFGHDLFICQLVDYEPRAMYLTNFYDSDLSVVVVALISVPFYIFIIRWINGPLRTWRSPEGLPQIRQQVTNQ